MAFLPKFRNNNKFLDIALLLFIFLVCFVPRLLNSGILHRSNWIRFGCYDFRMSEFLSTYVAEHIWHEITQRLNLTIDTW